MEIGGKKVLFVITKSNWGGAQRYVYDLATGFRDRGARVKVAYGGTGEAGAPQGALAAKLEAAGVEGAFVKSLMRDISFFREFKVLAELVRLFKTERPDVVHLNSSKVGGVGAVAGRIAGVPKIVFTSHGLAYDEDRGALMRAYLWFLTWLTFLFAHTVIVLSRDAYERARRFPLCGKKIRLVRNGIAQAKLIPREEARRHLLPAGRTDVPWIGTVAELTRNKGVSYLIDAARLLAVRGQAFTLCIIGSGEDYEALRTLIAGYGLSEQVHLLGFVKDAASYLEAFDIFTLTSVKEGQPYVLLEAAQAGCAVVASRIPGIEDVVSDHTGRLVAPKNAVAIAQALGELLGDETLRTTLGTALKMETARDSSLERMLTETAAAYR